MSPGPKSSVMGGREQEVNRWQHWRVKWLQPGSRREEHGECILVSAPVWKWGWGGICSLFSRRLRRRQFSLISLKTGTENQRKQECLWIQLVFQKAQRKALEGEISSDGEEDTGCVYLWGWDSAWLLVRPVKSFLEVVAGCREGRVTADEMDVKCCISGWWRRRQFSEKSKWLLGWKNMWKGVCFRLTCFEIKSESFLLK